MAERKVTSTLYLDGAPADEELNPFAIRLGPAAQRATGRKTTAKRKGDKPRNLNVRVKPQAQISAPRIATPDRALMALERFSPTLGSAAREADDFLGIRDLWRSGVRSAADALGGDVYAGNEDLQYDDRQNLLLNAALTVAGGPLAKGAGRLGGSIAKGAEHLGGAALRRLPAGVRQGASDLAARGASWMRENAPLLSRGVSAPLRDADYIEGVARELPEEMGAFAVRPQGQRQIATTYREPMALPAPLRVPMTPADLSDERVLPTLNVSDRNSLMEAYAPYTEMVPISWLENLEGNDLRYGGARLRALAEDIALRGIANPLLVSVGKESGSAILGEGNHRLAAARMAGYTHVPVRVQVGDEIGDIFAGRSDLVPEAGRYFPSQARPSRVFTSLQEGANPARSYMKVRERPPLDPELQALLDEFALHQLREQQDAGYKHGGLAVKRKAR